MSEAVRTRKTEVLDERIEEFCQKSANLLTCIHDRCNNNGKGAKPKKAKRGRKKKEDKNSSPSEETDT